MCHQHEYPHLFEFFSFVETLQGSMHRGANPAPSSV
jgi:hypothetical protein